jgi:hypothetical protein
MGSRGPPHLRRTIPATPQFYPSCAPPLSGAPQRARADLATALPRARSEQELERELHPVRLADLIRARGSTRLQPDETPEVGPARGPPGDAGWWGA